MSGTGVRVVITQSPLLKAASSRKSAWIEGSGAGTSERHLANEHRPKCHTQRVQIRADVHADAREFLALVSSTRILASTRRNPTRCLANADPDLCFLSLQCVEEGQKS